MMSGKKIIALCTSRMGEMSNFELVTALNDAAVENGSALMVYSLNADLYYYESMRSAEAHIFDLMDFSEIDVLVIAVEKIKHEDTINGIMSRAREHDVPIIVVDGWREGCINVKFNYKRGFEKVVRHITDHHGITDIHYLAGHKGNSFSEERRAVLEKVLSEKGVSFGEENVSYGDFWEGPAKKAAEELIRTGRVPGALICANDVMAISAMEVFKAHGYNVPGDIAITGFDGIEEIYFSLPRITSCSCSHVLLGREIAELAERCISGELREGDFYVEPELIVSGSCGCKDDMSVNIPVLMYSLNNRVYRIQDDNQALSRSTEGIQNAETIEEAAKQFDSYVYSDVTCFINKRCTDPSLDLFRTDYAEPFDDDMVLLHDFGSGEEGYPRDFRRSQLHPNMQRLFEKKCPIVFSAIEYLNVPLGYVIFHFLFDDVTNYCRIHMIISALNNAIGGYVNIHNQQYLLGQVENMYRYDSLTGLHNRISFGNEFRRIRDKVISSGGALTIVIADLDDLKGINDRFGHIAGDKAIRAVADALKSACPGDAQLVRLGGDEMMAIMEGAADQDSIRAGIDRSLAEFNAKNNEEYTASASAGFFSTSDPEEMTPELLIKRADELMYEEKRAKKLKRSVLK